MNGNTLTRILKPQNHEFQRTFFRLLIHCPPSYLPLNILMQPAVWAE